MKILLGLTLIGVAFSACEFGYYGDNCENYCIGCPSANRDQSGKCADSECEVGWAKNPADEDRCSTPICFGEAGCKEGGNCIAPNYCMCGHLGSQIVSFKKPSAGQVDYEAGIQCLSLRKSGLKGAFAAICMMLLSISFCGFVAPKKTNQVLINQGEKKKTFGVLPALGASIVFMVLVCGCLFKVTEIWHNNFLEGLYEGM